VPAPIIIAWISVVDGADDVDGVEVVVVGSKEFEGFDDGVDDHGEAIGLQTSSISGLLAPSAFVLK